MDIEDRIKELKEKITHCNIIIDGLENNEAFNLLLEDYKKQMKNLDDNWQWITDEKVLKEAQITKMATLSIVNCIETYRNDLKKAQEELEVLQNPDKKIIKDWDKE